MWLIAWLTGYAFSTLLVPKWPIKHLLSPRWLYNKAKKWLYKEKMTHRSPIEWFHFILQYTGFICNNKPFRSWKLQITYMKCQQRKVLLPHLWWTQNKNYVLFEDKLYRFLTGRCIFIKFKNSIQEKRKEQCSVLLKCHCNICLVLTYRSFHTL